MTQITVTSIKGGLVHTHYGILRFEMLSAVYLVPGLLPGNDFREALPKLLTLMEFTRFWLMQFFCSSTGSWAATWEPMTEAEPPVHER